jgi:alanine dehydrogenase
MTLLLNRQDVAGLLTMNDAIRAVEEAFRQLALGQVIMPQRTAIRIAGHNGLHLGMQAYIGGELDALALKVVTVYTENPGRHGLPTTIGVLLLNDARTGAPLAVMDAGYLTAVRTGAVSGVATKYLARPDASRVGIFGAGVQAKAQLRAMCAVRPIRAAQVYDVDVTRARSYAEEMSGELKISVTPVESPRAAVEGMDVVVLASSASQPVLDGDWLVAGQHINGIGSHAPHARELDTKAIVKSKVIADYPEACLVEAGDLIIPIKEGAIGKDHIHAGLGDVIVGLKPGRQTREEITLFKSVGLALQDVSTAHLVYQKALEAKVGTEFRFS